MWNEKPTQHKIIEVKTKRKSKGGKRDGRSGESGKVGFIFDCSEFGKKVQLAKESGGTFRDLSKKLRATGHIPSYVIINTYGETRY